MTIEDDIKGLSRDRALRIVADTLKHFSDDHHRLAIAATFSRTVCHGNVDIFLIAPPRSDCPIELQEHLDEGCQEGQCESCKVLLWSRFKYATCPICGADAQLT